MKKKELRAAMARYGDTNETLAKAIGMSPQAFSSKINGKKNFRQNEILAIIKRYALSPEHVVSIFFASEVPCEDSEETNKEQGGKQ